MKPDYSYLKTLEYFLAHSDADLSDSRAFIDRLPQHQPRFWQKLRDRASITWLEVGPGPGAKTLDCARELVEKYGVRIDIIAIEPCRGWHALYRKNVTANGTVNGRLNVELIPATWERFSMETSTKFDMVTFFHSIYGVGVHRDVMPSLSALAKVLRPDGGGCVVLESRDCGLNAIKRDIFHRIYDETFVSPELVEASLREFGISYELDPALVNQSFFVDDFVTGSEPGKDAVLGFLTYQSPETYVGSIAPTLGKSIEDSLKERIGLSGGRYPLDVKDQMIWIGR